MYNVVYNNIYKEMNSDQFLTMLQHYITTFFGEYYVENQFPDLNREGIDENLSNLEWAFKYPQNLTSEQRKVILITLNTLIEDLWSLNVEPEGAAPKYTWFEFRNSHIDMKKFTAPFQHPPSAPETWVTKEAKEKLKQYILGHFSGLVYRYRTTLFKELGDIIFALPRQYFPISNSRTLEDLKPGELDQVYENFERLLLLDEKTLKIFGIDKEKAKEKGMTEEEFSEYKRDKIASILLVFMELKNEYNSLFWITPNQARYALSETLGYFLGKKPKSCENSKTVTALDNENITIAQTQIQHLAFKKHNFYEVLQPFSVGNKTIISDKQTFKPPYERTSDFHKTLLNIGLPELVLTRGAKEARKTYVLHLHWCLKALVNCHRRYADEQRQAAIEKINQNSGEPNVQTNQLQCAEDATIAPLFSYSEAVTDLRQQAFQEIKEIYGKFISGILMKEPFEYELNQVVELFQYQIGDLSNNLDTIDLTKNQVNNSINQITKALFQVILVLNGVEMLLQNNDLQSSLNVLNDFSNTLKTNSFSLVTNEENKLLVRYGQNHFEPETLRKGLITCLGFEKLNLFPVVSRDQQNTSTLTAAPFHHEVTELFEKQLQTLALFKDSINQLKDDGPMNNNNIINNF